jgi:hypothetical protein
MMSNKEASIKLSNLPFADHSAFMFNMDATGYIEFVFGGRAGPSVDISNLAHEMAHAVEFGAKNYKNRYRDGNFVFKSPGYIVILGRYIRKDNITYESTLREIRTMGIQRHFLEAMGTEDSLEEYIEDMADVCDFIPDSWIVPKLNNSQKSWIKQELLIAYNSWTKEMVCDEFTKWLNCVAKRLSTKTHKIADVNFRVRDFV